MPRFSEVLVNSNPIGLREATQHPFLKAAAQGSLPQDQLVTWLAQDRLYALSYVTFMGQLLSKVTVPSTSGRTQTLAWRVADCLIDCLDNIRRELKLFEDTAAEHGWSATLDSAIPSVQTQAYKDLFAGAGQPSASLFRGIITLWATEECYLRAWSYARQYIPASASREEGARVMQEVFIPNWSSAEFVQFVERIKVLVNEMADVASAEERQQAEEQWNQVLWAEQAFWPS